METLAVIIFSSKKIYGHNLPCGSSSSHALNYSLSPTCGTASTWVHQPCTKLLRSRVTVDYPNRTAAVMPNEPSNHKTPSFPAVSWTDEATIISLFSLSFLSTQLASPSSCSSFLQENPDLLLPFFFSPKEGKVSTSMVLILAKVRPCNPETDPITPSLFFFWFVIMVSFLLFLFDSFLMDAGTPA